MEGCTEQLKAARLARRLGVTTGSFYWHFQGLAEFRSALLEYWKEDVVGGLIRTAKASETETAQVLPTLRTLILESGAHDYDTAMREWARSDPLVREAVESADQARATFLVEALRAAGMAEDDARDRANLIGAAWRGSKELADPDYRMKLIRLAGSN